MLADKESRIVDRIEAAIQRDERGRKSPRDKWFLLVVGLFLTAAHRRSTLIRDVHRTLTQELTIDDQFRIGVRRMTDGEEWVVREADLYNRIKDLKKGLEYGFRSSPDISIAERARRREVIQEITQAVCDLFDLVPTSTVAIDSTGIWAWKVGPTAEEVESSGADASYGWKTGRGDDTEMYYGYEEHTLVAEYKAKDEGPKVIVGFEVTPPGGDLAATTLGLIDRVGDIKHVIADRHYQYKKPETWAMPLAERGITQTLDLRADQQGIEYIDDVAWVAGYPHCPAMPHALGDITRPSVGEKDRKVWKKFHRRIKQRQTYALKLNAIKDSVSGKGQYICPALDGKLGCALRGNDRDAHELGMIVIDNPPDPNEPLCPKICTQATAVCQPNGAQRKLMQPHYWGSKRWSRDYRRRSSVEGSYGNRKNSQSENLKRWNFRPSGVGVANFFALGPVVSYNTRMTRNWHERTGLGNPEHPLLKPDIKVFGYRVITEAELVSAGGQVA